MKSIFHICIFVSVIFLIGCSTSPERKIVNPADYESYLSGGNDMSLQKCNEEMEFWLKRLSDVPDGEAYRLKVAGLLSSRFMLNGRIEDIAAADSIYRLVLGNDLPYASVHRSLAANAITQHKFREARKEIEKSLAIGEGKAASLYMLVDVSLELGDYEGAATAMKKFTNRTSFPYLVREAKLKDHEGKLDSAIVLMEKALEQAKENPSLFLWTQSNLGDMYGHAGRIEDSYKAYLNVLKQNPDYDYALKGIAWIAYSHDHDFAEAKRIVRFIEPRRATPDMHLLLAQIADAENDTDEKIKQLSLFRKLARASKYGDMYNKYLALLEAEEFSNPTATIAIAEKEIENRPTPQSYDLLAWGYYNKGDLAGALAIARQRIENKTYEPDALYHLGVIYQANGMTREAKRYFKQAEESSFELGPVIARKIKQQRQG
jgi:tetratricopeptide (TPR) repeat protein